MTSRSTISRKFMTFDLFAKNTSFRENGRDSFQSILGAFVSVLIFIPVLAYGFRKCDILINRADTIYSSYVDTNG